MTPETQDRMEYGKNGAAFAVPKVRPDYKSFRELHGIVRQNSLPLRNTSRFAASLALHCPQAAERIDEDDFGILHLEVGALKLETRAAILSNDWLTVTDHFAFVANTLADCGAELSNAIRISYLGMLFYGETSRDYAEARSLLPELLAEVLEEIERHYDSRPR